MGYGQAALCIFRTVFTMENKTQTKKNMVGKSAGITGYAPEIPRFCFPFFVMASPVGDVGDARWVGTIAVGENLGWVCSFMSCRRANSWSEDRTSLWITRGILDALGVWGAGAGSSQDFPLGTNLQKPSSPSPWATLLCELNCIHLEKHNPNSSHQPWALDNLAVPMKISITII